MNIAKMRPYLLAKNIKKEEENYMLWLQGLYIKRAFEVVMCNAFSKSKSNKAKYLEEPIRITPLTEEEKAEKVETERQKAINFFNSLEKSYNKKLAERG